MGKLYSRIVNKLSYRIDDEAINRYLSIHNKYAPRLTEEKMTPELRKLLALLENSPDDFSTEWIELYSFGEEENNKTCRLRYSPVSLNQIPQINRFLREQNEKLGKEGKFVCWFQPSTGRKLMIFKRYPGGIAHLFYFFDFSWHRVFPKLPFSRRIYYAVTKGKNNVYPRTEILGRLYCCGFEVVAEHYIKNKYFVIANKVREPYNDPHPSYGPLIRLKRVGLHGKMITVYKFRTMHAYSEYLQAYIYENHHLQEGGKFTDDHRVTTWGKYMRKCWLDELPMILNILKGEMKIIGVRPLSKHYFSLYSPELQELRTRTKPGLLPPFYVDMPKDLAEIEASETKYLESYLKHPFRTDWNYFWKIINNILIRRRRSA